MSLQVLMHLSQKDRNTGKEAWHWHLIGCAAFDFLEEDDPKALKVLYTRLAYKTPSFDVLFQIV